MLSTKARIKASKSEPRKDLIIKSYEDIEDVVNTNSFEMFDLLSSFYTTSQCPRKGTSLYQKICMINHCCEANCSRINIGQTMVIYSVDDIKQGQEIFMCYKKQIKYQDRHQALQMYDINCNCVFCEEQLYELKNGKKKKEGRSRQMNFIELSTDFLENVSNYDKKMKMFNLCTQITDAAGLFILGKDLALAAGIFCRIFPMNQKQGLDILQGYLKK